VVSRQVEPISFCRLRHALWNRAPMATRPAAGLKRPRDFFPPPCLTRSPTREFSAANDKAAKRALAEDRCDTKKAEAGERFGS